MWKYNNEEPPVPGKDNEHDSIPLVETEPSLSSDQSVDEASSSDQSVITSLNNQSIDTSTNKPNECCYCHKVLLSQYTLKIHQQKTKRCLKLQGINNPSIHKCDYCPYNTNNKPNYDRHFIKCKGRLQKETQDLERLKIENKIYKEQLIIAQKTTSKIKS